VPHRHRGRLTVRPDDPTGTGEGEGLLASVGCYRIEGRGAQLFARVEGAQATIMGMPLWPLLEALRTNGALPS
jgi:septum formation protein